MNSGEFSVRLVMRDFATPWFSLQEIPGHHLSSTPSRDGTISHVALSAVEPSSSSRRTIDSDTLSFLRFLADPKAQTLRYRKPTLDSIIDMFKKDSKGVLVLGTNGLYTVEDPNAWGRVQQDARLTLDHLNRLPTLPEGIIRALVSFREAYRIILETEAAALPGHFCQLGPLLSPATGTALKDEIDRATEQQQQLFNRSVNQIASSPTSHGATASCPQPPETRAVIDHETRCFLKFLTSDEERGSVDRKPTFGSITRMLRKDSRGVYIRDEGKFYILINTSDWEEAQRDARQMLDKINSLPPLSEGITRALVPFQRAYELMLETKGPTVSAYAFEYFRSLLSHGMAQKLKNEIEAIEEPPSQPSSGDIRGGVLLLTPLDIAICTILESRLRALLCDASSSDPEMSPEIRRVVDTMRGFSPTSDIHDYWWFLASNLRSYDVWRKPTIISITDTFKRDPSGRYVRDGGHHVIEDLAAWRQVQQDAQRVLNEIDGAPTLPPKITDALAPLQKGCGKLLTVEGPTIPESIFEDLKAFFHAGFSSTLQQELEAIEEDKHSQFRHYLDELAHLTLHDSNGAAREVITAGLLRALEFYCIRNVGLRTSIGSGHIGSPYFMLELFIKTYFNLPNPSELYNIPPFCDGPSQTKVLHKRDPHSEKEDGKTAVAILLRQGDHLAVATRNPTNNFFTIYDTMNPSSKIEESRISFDALRDLSVSGIYVDETVLARIPPPKIHCIALQHGNNCYLSTAWLLFCTLRHYHQQLSNEHG